MLEKEKLDRDKISLSSFREFVSESGKDNYAVEFQSIMDLINNVIEDDFQVNQAKDMHQTENYFSFMKVFFGCSFLTLLLLGYFGFKEHFYPVEKIFNTLQSVKKGNLLVESPVHIKNRFSDIHAEIVLVAKELAKKIGDSQIKWEHVFGWEEKFLKEKETVEILSDEVKNQKITIASQLRQIEEMEEKFSSEKTEMAQEKEKLEGLKVLVKSQELRANLKITQAQNESEKLSHRLKLMEKTEQELDERESELNKFESQIEVKVRILEDQKKKLDEGMRDLELSREMLEQDRLHTQLEGQELKKTISNLQLQKDEVSGLLEANKKVLAQLEREKVAAHAAISELDGMKEDMAKAFKKLKKLKSEVVDRKRPEHSV